MKKLLILFAFLTFSSVAHAAIAFVQDTSTGNLQAMTTVSRAFGSNNTAGNIIIACTSNVGLNRTHTVTDTVGNTYVQVSSRIQVSENTQMAVYAAQNIGAGANTVTLAVSGTGVARNSLIVKEFSGLATSSAFDVTASSQANAPTTANTTSTASTAQADELLVGCFRNGSGGTYTIGSGYSNLEANAQGRAAAEDQIVSSIGTYNATSAISGTNPRWVAIITTWKAAGAAAVVSPPQSNVIIVDDGG